MRREIDFVSQATYKAWLWSELIQSKYYTLKNAMKSPEFTLFQYWNTLVDIYGILYRTLSYLYYGYVMHIFKFIVMFQ